MIANHRVQMLLIGLVLCGSGLTGCGAAKYEERLAASSRMFEHRLRLDENLQGVFRDSEAGVEIRPPRGFDWISAPDGKDDAEEGVVDPRQYPHFEYNLPGLIGAWKSDVVATDGDSSTAGVAYYYLLSSTGPAVDDDEDRDFRTVLLETLSHELAANITKGSLYEAYYPQSNTAGYVDQVPYQEQSVIPDHLYDNLQTEVAIYLHEAEGITAAVLTIVPKGAADQSRIRNRIDLSLQTLRVRPPVQAGQAGAGSKGGM